MVHNQIIYDFGNIRLVIIDLDELNKHYYKSSDFTKNMCQVCHKRPIYALLTCGSEECIDAL